MNITNTFRGKAYVVRVQNFLSMAQDKASGSKLIRYPCRRCVSKYYNPIGMVKEHILT